MTDQHLQDQLDAYHFAFRALAEALEFYKILDTQHLQANVRICADGMLGRGGMRPEVHKHLIGLADQLLLDSFHRLGYSPEEARQRMQVDPDEDAEGS